MSIFISIASYEDPYLIDTVKSALENAKDPDDLIFGLCLQYKIEPDLSFLSKKQKRILSFDPETRPGLVKARYLIKEMMFDEDYFFQIDSHTKFEKNWDETLINLLSELKKINPNGIICAAPSQESYKDRSCSVKWKIANEFPLTFDHTVTYGQPNGSKFFKTQRFSGGGTFMDSKIAKNIFYDNISHAMHEVSYLSFVLIMLGYDMYDIYHCPFIHDNREYNKIIYGNQDFKNKKYSIEYYEKKDNLLYYEFAKAWLYNDKSLFKIKNTTNNVENFWLKIGLFEELFALKEKYDSMSEIKESW